MRKQIYSVHHLLRNVFLTLVFTFVSGSAMWASHNLAGEITYEYLGNNEIEITLEGAVFARSLVNQTVFLFNYDTDDWEQVDSRPANRFSDATANFSVTGDVSRFVQPGTNQIEARVLYQSANPRQRFSSNTDFFSWTISP